MSTQIVQTVDGNRPKLKVSTSEEAIQQARKSNNSTPQSTTSDSDDVNNNSKCNNNELAVQNFERFRESALEDATSPTLPPPGDSIAEYCAESLYSYSFTPLSRVNKAARIKKQILNRGMDYMQRIRWRPGERDTGRRFSQPDIGVLDQTHDWVVDNPTTTKRIYRDNGLPLTSAPPVTHNSILPTQSSPMPKVNPTQDEVDEEGFNLGRRQTLEVFNNLLPPVYEKNTHQLPCSAQYTRALHAPSRFLPQNQAILTTDDEATILLFNDIASLCFGIDKQYIGKSVLDTLEEPFKQQISGILKRRRHYHPDQQGKGGLVLVCGIVVPIHKINHCDAGAAASLWLKEKITEEGKRIYIWIFEEIYETSVSTVLDDQGRIVEVIGTPKDLFGYTSEEVVGKSISELIPALSNNLLTVDKLKFYGGRSKNGICFPTMINMSTNRLKIMSLPSIAGLITVHSTGKIQSINPVPAKYLFGYSTDALVNKFDIDQIIPKFSEVVDGLKRFNLLQLASTVNNHACRWVISELCTAETRDPSLKTLERQPSITANGQFLPIIHAVHRDGSQFEIQLQLRLIESDKENLISIWVTYDRIYAMKRAKRMAVLLQQQETTSSIENNDVHTDIPREPMIVSPSAPALSLHGEQDALPIPTHIKKRPLIKPYGISSFGSVDQKKALFPSGMDDNQLNTVALQDSKKPPHPMDDYVIIGTLGEGAYGAAKLAYRKDDITQTKVVIKFIAKSRIIVDSWIRDRQLGMIPLEIHILKKLREHPQENCSALESYAEDEDTYFVVTKQYGLSSMDLFDYIELNEHIEENEIRNIFRQVSLAVKHCQDLRIVHRDIKDENILLDENGRVHLIDFGSAAYFRKGRTFDTFGGTLDYCAPEILKGMPYEGPAQDIWSLGTLLYTLIYRENPFYNVDEIMEHDLRIPFVLSEGSLDLIKKMLNRDVEKRYTIHQVLEHPWLKSN